MASAWACAVVAAPAGRSGFFGYPSVMPQQSATLKIPDPSSAMQTLLLSAGFGISPPSPSPMMEAVSLKVGPRLARAGTRRAPCHVRDCSAAGPDALSLV